MPSGIIIIDKPAEWTSHDVVAKLRGIYRERRIGHAGTLDPMATGVLPVFVGRATKAVRFLEGADKIYLARLCLGVVTDTQDRWGSVVAQNEVKITRADLSAVLPEFTGEISQIPPMFSAIKKDGRRLYDLARKGVEVEREPRRVTVYDIRLTSGEDGFPPDGSENEYGLLAHCSKGTYVRTLCHDIGERLGCGGHMSYLRRLRVGDYGVEQAHTLDEAAAAPESFLLPVDTLFSALPSIIVDGQAEFKLKNGAPFYFENAPEGRLRAYSPEGRFLALCEASNGQVRVVLQMTND